MKAGSEARETEADGWSGVEGGGVERGVEDDETCTHALVEVWSNPKVTFETYLPAWVNTVQLLRDS